jgi:hypothetical protein
MLMTPQMLGIEIISLELTLLWDALRDVDTEESNKHCG